MSSWKLTCSLITGQIPDLLKSIGIAFFLRAAGAGLAFLLNVVIGRLLGASGAGLYFLSLSVVSIAAVVARLGLENTVLRFVSSYSSANNWGQARGVLRYALIWSGGVSLVFALIIVGLAPVLEQRVFETAGMAPFLVMLSLSIVSFNTMIIMSEALKARGKIVAAMLVGGVFYPLTALILIYPANSLLGSVGAGLVYTLGTVFASVVGLLLWKSALPDVPPEKVNRREIRQSSRPLWVMTIIHRAILPWTPLLLLGLWSTTADAGGYGAASRLSILVSFFLVSVNAVVGPRFAAFYVRGEIEQIKYLGRRFSTISTLVVLPLLCIIIANSARIMGLFGEDFAQYGMVLSILVAGQAINAFTGSVEFILMMTAHERDMRNIVAIAMSIMLLTGVILVPNIGVTGAAISGACATAFTSLLSSIMVRYRLGFWVFPFSAGKQK